MSSVAASPKRISSAVAVLAVIVAAPFGLSPMAGAFEGEPIRYEVREGNRVAHDYRVPTAGSGSGAVRQWNPDQCAAIGWCVRIPIDIVPPAERGETNDWIVDLRVDWDARDVNAGPTSAEGNDLDILLWRWQQTEDDEGNPEYDDDGSPHEDWVEVAGSESGSSPEVIKLYRPDGEYHLTVENFSGVNIDFTVGLDSVDASFQPFDPFATPAERAGTPGGPVAAPPPSDRGGREVGASPSVSPSLSPRAATLESPGADRASIGSDADFAFAGRMGFEDELAAAPTRGNLYRQEDLGPPRPVSGSTVLVWMGSVPLVLLVGGGAALLKFRPAALTIRVPGRR